LRSYYGCRGVVWLFLEYTRALAGHELGGLREEEAGDVLPVRRVDLHRKGENGPRLLRRRALLADIAEKD
jgi:hypothetical protein